MEKLSAISRGYSNRFPRGSNPFQMITRLAEECGELAKAVNHCEGSGVKRAKYGEPDRGLLAKEIMDVLHTALQVAQHYGVEQELHEVIDRTYQKLKQEGFIV